MAYALGHLIHMQATTQLVLRLKIGSGAPCYFILFFKPPCYFYLNPFGNFLLHAPISSDIQGLRKLYPLMLSG